MKVKELISELQKYDPDKDIDILSPSCNPLIDIGQPIDDIFEICGSVYEENNRVYILLAK